jgi:DNA-binding Lrp family transcriptional regulator
MARHRLSEAARLLGLSEAALRQRVRRQERGGIPRRGKVDFIRDALGEIWVEVEDDGAVASWEALSRRWRVLEAMVAELHEEITRTREATERKINSSER